MVLTEAIFPKPEAARLPLLLLLTTLLAFVLPPSTLCPVDEGLRPSDPALLPALLTDLLLTVLLLGSLKPASVSTAAMPASACKHDSTHHDECMASCTTVSKAVAKLAPKYQSEGCCTSIQIRWGWTGVIPCTVLGAKQPKHRHTEPAMGDPQQYTMRGLHAATHTNHGAAEQG